MRTAMIAALSCALLGGPLVTLPAFALQCDRGQATLKVTDSEFKGIAEFRPKLGRGYRSTEYSVSVEGRSEIDLAEIKEPAEVDGMSLHLVIGSLAPKELKYVEKTKECLRFGAWIADKTQDLSLITVWGDGVTTSPTICIDGSGSARLKLMADVNEKFVENYAHLGSGDFRVYVKGKRRSDGSAFTIFDTNNACEGALPDSPPVPPRP